MTTTTNKGLSLPTVGGESGTWGTDVNSNVITPLDLMLGGIASISLSSTNYTGTSSDIQNLQVKFSGTLLANVSVLWSGVGFYIIENNCTGNFTVNFVANFGAGNVGTSQLIPQGSRVLVVSDTATGARFVNPIGGAIPSGSLQAFAGSSAPSGWVLCFGQAISRTIFAGLFAAISTTYGTGDGSTTFNVPDLRGRSLFGLDNMGGTPAGRLAGGNTGNITSSTTLGSTGGEENHTVLTAEMPAHNHGVTDPGHSHTFTGVTTFNTSVPNGGPSTIAVVSAGQTTGTSTTGISINNTGGGGSHNTTPPAMVMNWIIKT